MASTTIRVSAETRDNLNRLCAESGRPVDAVVGELVAMARGRSLLDAAVDHWHAVIVEAPARDDDRRLADELTGFDAEAPEY